MKIYIFFKINNYILATESIINFFLGQAVDYWYTKICIFQDKNSINQETCIYHEYVHIQLYAHKLENIVVYKDNTNNVLHSKKYF